VPGGEGEASGENLTLIAQNKAFVNCTVGSQTSEVDILSASANLRRDLVHCAVPETPAAVARSAEEIPGAVDQQSRTWF
jgi:hypothetical protein